MKVSILTNEFPPNIYGGAGVHVDYLTRELQKLTDVDVMAFGDQNFKSEHLVANGFKSWDKLKGDGVAKCLEPFSINLDMIKNFPKDSKLVHCHTWYTFMAGYLAKVVFNIPLVVTTHSLEPLRPWKAEQLGPCLLYTSRCV